MFKRNTKGMIGAIEVALIVVVLIVGGLIVWRVMSGDESATSEETTVDDGITVDRATDGTTTNEDTATTVQTTDNSATVIAMAEAWCLGRDEPCSPQVLDATQDHAVVDTGPFRLLFSLNDADIWELSIASEEQNICDTGTDQPDLLAYCTVE
jgi:hypothetical protein